MVEVTSVVYSTSDAVTVTFSDNSSLLLPWPFPDPLPLMREDQAAALKAWDGEPEPKPVTAEDVISERRRRLAVGFDYDFRDARGVHDFGTTRDDIVGWSEINAMANALIDTNQANATFDIETNTGRVTVSATEWLDIMLTASAWRQPIWLGSFSLQKMDPIPQDYATNDSYWQ